MLTSMKTCSFLSNYKGVCSVFLWGCPAALPTLWGLCFSHFLPPHPSLSLSPPLSFSASVHLLILAPFFRWIGERVSFIYSFASHLLFPLSSPLFFPSPFFRFIPLPPSLLRSPTHSLIVTSSVSRIASLFGFGLFAVWNVLLLILCRAEIMTVYFAAIIHVHQRTEVNSECIT